MFPRVSAPELVTRLCLHSSRQHRVGRPSTCSHRTQQYWLHGTHRLKLLLWQSILRHISTSIMPRVRNKAVFPQQTTPGRSCVDMVSSHTAVLSPPRTDSNSFCGQYFMFPRVSGPEPVTRLGLHSSNQHRNGSCVSVVSSHTAVRSPQRTN